MPNPETGFFVSASVALAGLSWNESHRSILPWVKHTQAKPYDSSALWIRQWPREDALPVQFPAAQTGFRDTEHHLSGEEAAHNFP